jgi:peptidoglycan hydrolase-like protein with peptidoglycan-binding domain
MLMLLLASTSIAIAGCGDRGTAYRGTGDSSTAIGTSTTDTRMAAGTPGSTSGAVPPGGLASATVLSSPADVRTVQNRLRQLNFYGGEATGYWNTDTELGLRNFQRAHGLAVARLDQTTLKAMGLEGTATGGGQLSDIAYARSPQAMGQTAAAPPQAAQPPMPPEQRMSAIAPAAGPRAGAGMIGRNLDQSSVRQVQQKLAGEGFYKAKVDGIWGPQSQDALLEFQDRRNLQVSGRLTPETVSALGIDQSQLKWKSGPRAMRR